MQTNSANGHHQHEVSEKRPPPGAFPCRLDMEICICGARRWVNQNGTPATLWQFINLGTSPIREGDARVAPRTSPQSALEGLITCGSCGQPMLLDDTQGEREASYACQQGPGTEPLSDAAAACPPDGDPGDPQRAQAVLTEENISRALAVADDPGRYDEAREHSLTRQDLQEVRENPERFVLAAGGTPRTRHFLGRITTGIQVHAARAVIHYSIPLPEDSPLAGMRRQEIDLPEEILAWWTTTGT